ncbi:MAG: ATP-binding cassette domain-containing protein [Bdellovibrionales bacterium]|nr:ATP-binding cassette domain-containing protein [Bdellovibrionales bacterium]
MESTAIEFLDVSRSFKRRERESGLLASLRAFVQPRYTIKAAVDHMSFSVPRGACVGLVGANGAGKTTLLKMASGLLHPTSGDVRVLGFYPAERDHDFLRRIGMVMGQKSQLWVDIPALETFELLAAIYDIPPEQYRERLAHLTEVLQVKAILGVQVRKLSLGERMKCEIIASLLHNPELLFLDEPTIGLDVVAKHAIREFIAKYNREQKTTIILSSHDMSDITELCEYLLFVHEGKLLYTGPLADFNARYNRGDSAKELESLVREIMSGSMQNS